MIDVVTFYFHRWCSEYRANYIRSLYLGLKWGSSVPFHFHLITDELISGLPKGVNLIPFEPKFKGNLNKSFVFNEELGFENQVFVFDLDMVICGGIDDFLGYRGDFACLEGVYPQRYGKVAGSLYSFNPKKFYHIYDVLKLSPETIASETQGSERRFFDQVLANKDVDFIQKMYPNRFISYKAEFLQQGSTDAPHCSVLWFHGSPRPHELRGRYQFLDEYFQWL